MSLSPPPRTPPNAKQSASAASATPPPPVRWHWGSALAGALLTAVVLGGVTFALRRPTPPPIAIHAPPTPTIAVTGTPTPTATPAPLVVFVSGAVQAPGVYALPSGARVVDALNSAGGFAPDANVDAVNQAALLHDGDQLYVPTRVEEPQIPASGLTNDTRQGAVVDVGSGDTTNAVAGPVNVNTATAEELDTLPGIGPARAADIIANRPYASVDDLERVPGIGPVTLEKLRPYVVVE